MIVPGVIFSGAVRSCRGSSGASPATTASTTCSTGPATRRTARRPARRRSRSSPCCSSAARRTSSPARSTSRSATSRRPAGRRRWSARRSPTSSTWRLCRALRRRGRRPSAPSAPAASSATPAAATTASTRRRRSEDRAPVGRSGDVMIAGWPPPLTEQAEDIDRVWNVLPASPRSSSASLVVVLIVYRRRPLPPPRRPTCRRRSTSNIPLELTYTVVPAPRSSVVLFAVTFVLGATPSTRPTTTLDLVVEVIGVPVAVAVRLPRRRASSSIGTDARDARARAAGRRDGALRPHVASTSSTRSGSPASASSATCSRARRTSFHVDVGDAHRRRSRTPACAPSSAGSTTRRCASRCASSRPTSSSSGCRQAQAAP